MPIRIDTSRLPLVLVTWDGRVSDDEMAAYLKEMDKVARLPDRRAIIMDASTAMVPSASQRKMQGEWLKANDHLIRGKTVGTAFVIPSTIVRGALTAVFWIQGMSSEYLVCATREEGMAWAIDRLRSAGVPLRNAAGA